MISAFELFAGLSNSWIYEEFLELERDLDLELEIAEEEYSF